MLLQRRDGTEMGFPFGGWDGLARVKSIWVSSQILLSSVSRGASRRSFSFAGTAGKGADFCPSFFLALSAVAGMCVIGFCVGRKVAGSLEPGAGSTSHRDRDVRYQTVRRQTSDCHIGVIGFLCQAQGSRELGAWSRERVS